MPRILDLFCGEGGAGSGYALAGFEVVGVDSSAARLRRYPFECVQADALAFVHQHGHEFDAIHASPTCTGYSRGTAALPDRLERYDRLIPAVRELLIATGRPYVIENVADARPELRDPITLCWSEFYEPGSVTDEDGTPLTMRRHRLFESNVTLSRPGACRHPRGMQVAGSYGGARRDPVEARAIRRGGYVPKSTDVQRRLLGTPWMSEKGCQLSIPPAYTHHIGTQLLHHLTPKDRRMQFTTLDDLWCANPTADRIAALAQQLASKGAGHALTRIDYLTEILHSAEVLRAEAVAQARREGESWQRIGANMGITKQAAQQRYGTSTPTVDPAQLTIEDAR